MEVFEFFKGMYHCSQLPAYANFLLDYHLEDFSKAQIELGRDLNLPVLISLSSRLTNEQLEQLSINYSKEFLQLLSENKAYEQVKLTIERWSNDQLEVINKKEIVARDIILINHIRGVNLKKFIPAYTSDLRQALAISAEIDSILLGNITTSTDIYIDMLKQTIEEQSNLASKVIDASPAVTFLFSTISKSQIFVSNKVIEVMGYTPEEIMQMGDSFLTNLAHPHDLGKLVEHINDLISEKTNKTTPIEYRFRHKDGKYRWLRTYDVIFKRDREGRPLEILGKTFEITHEKQIAMDLEKREKQLLEAQALAHIGSYEWNIKENTSTNNSPEVFRIFELQEEQKYEEFLSFVHPEDIQKVKDAIELSFKSGHYECEYRYIKGKQKVILSIGRVEFRNNEPFRMVGTVQDITEMKKMEMELMQKSSELAHSNESLRQFAYIASHDMKEPLRKIMMYSDMVMTAENSHLSEKSVNQLKKMQLAGRNLYRMIEDILSFSLLEAKEQKHKINLGAVVSEVTELLDESILEKNATITYTNMPDAVVIVSQFRQLFQNLIANSLKFSLKDEPPKIVITAKITRSPSIELPLKSDHYLEVCVEDNGIGFPDKVKEEIFELFNRYHDKLQYEGTGLGLSISQRIVENHKGLIRAYPGAQSGAKFIIVIPQ